MILLEALDRVLPTEDADISRLVERGLKRQGDRGPHGHRRSSDVRAPSSTAVSFSYGAERAEVDYLVIAAGRGADVEGLGLAEAGVETRRARPRRGRRRACAPRAPGCRRSATSCTARRSRTRPPTRASSPPRTARGARRTRSPTWTSRARPSAPRTSGSFGLTEEQAREQGHDVVVGKVPYGAVGGGTVYGDRTGLVKIVGERRYGELLGGHIVGSRATELIQELVNVRALEGGFPEVARIVHGHPTLSEAVMEAARAADGWLIHG